MLYYNLSGTTLQRKVTQTKEGNIKHNQTTTILFFTLLLTYSFLETIQIQTQRENIGQLNDTSPRKNHTGYHQFTYHSWTYHQGIHTLLLINFYISLMNYSPQMQNLIAFSLYSNAEIYRILSSRCHGGTGDICFIVCCFRWNIIAM